MKNNLASHANVVRPPACAGRFYPSAATQLRAEVDRYLASANVSCGTVPKAVIAPHAGYIYSGPIAASAYACLVPARAALKRVVLVGPSHYAHFSGLAASQADAFATPLGPVPLDKNAVAGCCALPGVMAFEEAHEREHCLEVQLPFLQTILDQFRIIPLLVGEATDEEISDVLQMLWGGLETCIVISSDLSHYRDYKTARKLDHATSVAIEGLRADELNSDQACGCLPIRGLLRLARRLGLRCRAVDLRNSGDTAGARDRVVGYGAFVLTQN